MARGSKRITKRTSYYSYNNRGYYNKPYSYANKANNSLVSRAWKSIKEANNINSTLDFAFKINYAFVARYDSTNQTGVAAINCYDVLFKSENFKNMMKNWDQIKINGVTCRINVTDYSVASGNAVNVVTGWDKTGLSVVPLATSTIEANGGYGGDVWFFDTATPAAVTVDNAILAGDWDNADKAAKAYCNRIGKKITEGYGAKKGLLNSYQRFSRYESCWPTTMDEKCCYIPTANFTTFSGPQGSTGLCLITDTYNEQCVNDLLAISNPCVPFENNDIKWKPTLLVGCFKTSVTGGTVTQYGDCGDVVFNAEFTIPVTFKGQKGDS